MIWKTDLLFCVDLIQIQTMDWPILLDTGHVFIHI